MANGWKTVPLAQVLRQDTNYVTELEPITYPKLSVKLYGKGVTLDAPADGANVKMQRHQFSKPGQVILSEIWAKKGAIGIVPPDGAGALVTSHFFLFDIDETKVLPDFIGWLLKGNFFAELLDAQAHGTTGYAAVRPKQFLALEIPLPPLTEQRRIVARIEALAARVAEAQSLRREASEQTTAMLNAARNFAIGEKPNKDWLPLRTYLAEIFNGKSPDCEKRPANLDEWAVLKVGAVSFGVFDENENKALPSHMQPNPEYEVKEGDFLMIRANTKELCGACAIVGKTRPKLLLSDKTFRFIFREDKPIDKNFLNHVLKSPALRTQIEQQASGTSPTMKNISKEKVMELRIPPFLLEEQQRLVAYLDGLQAQVFALRAAQAESERELSALMPSVLDRAFKGEL